METPMRLFNRNGTWYVEIKRGEKRSLKTGNEREANRIFKRLQKEWLENRLIRLDAQSNVTLGQFTKDYFESRSSMSPKTQKHDALALSLLADVIGATTPLKLVNVKRIDDFKQALLHRGVKATSVNSYLRHIKSALSKAVEWELIEKKPVIKMLPVPRHLPTFLSKSQIDLILDKAKEMHPEFHPMLVVYLWTGARRNELLNLQWQHCHIAEANPYLILTGKGDKQRTVPALPQVIDVLLPAIKDVGHVFPQWNESTLTHWYKAISRACGIESHLHELRHTAATYMLASGIPIRVVQEILGHADLATTGIYAHVVKEHLHREMGKLRFE